MPTLPDIPLPSSIRSRYVDGINGLTMHVLEAELIVFCRKHLSPIKCPKSIDFEAELPRTPTG